LNFILSASRQRLSLEPESQSGQEADPGEVQDGLTGILTVGSFFREAGPLGVFFSFPIVQKVLHLPGGCFVKKSVPPCNLSWSNFVSLYGEKRRELRLYGFGQAKTKVLFL
jgi:hypothetical protein